MNPSTFPIHRGPDDGTWISWRGAPAQFVALGDETGDTYCLSRSVSAAGGGAPPHRHDFEEGFYLLAGSLTFVAGNQEHQLEAGDFINIGANVAHAIRNESGEPAEVLTLCGPAGFDRFQIEGGFPMKGSDDALVPDSNNVREKIFAAADNHGIDLDPPASAFEVAPQVTITLRGEGPLIDVVGDRYRFLAMGEDTGTRYAIWEALIGPGGGPPPHRHCREEEGFYLLEGTVTFSTPDGSFEASAGHFVHLPCGGQHWFRNETDQLARCLILVAPAGLEGMFRETGTEVESIDAPFSSPDPNEKRRLLEVAPRFGVEISIPIP